MILYNEFVIILNLEKRMKKLLCLLIGIILCTFCAVTVLAESEVDAVYYYVNSETGDDRGNDGLSAASPVKTFTRACNLAKNADTDVAYIVITNEYEITVNVNEVAHTVPFIVTTNDGKTDYALRHNAKIVFNGGRRYYLAGNTTFENIRIEHDTTLNFVAGFNRITMGDGVVTVCNDSKNRSDAGVYIVGGMQDPKKTDDATLNSYITVKSGSFKTVVGGSRMYADGESGGLHYTGTHRIDILGGEIEYLYGGTYANHWSNNIEITVSGGHIINLYASGDESRRAEGNATLNLLGGSADTVDVNNVQGDATVNLLGTKIGKMGVSYFNNSVLSGVKANARKVLNYSSLVYTAEDVAAFTGFETVTNSAYVFASLGGSGDGMSETSPTSFEDAMKKAAEKNANIMLLDDVTLSDFSEPKHGMPITVFARSGVSVTVSGKYTLGGKTVFDGLTLRGDGIFEAVNGKVVINENCNVAGDFEIEGSADIGTGKFESVTEAKDIQLRSGEVKSIVGTGENVLIEVFGGTVGSVRSAKKDCDTFTFTISGGTVEELMLNGVKNNFRLNVYGGTVGKYSASGENAQGSAVVSGSVDLGEVADITDISNDCVYFVSDDGNGGGRSANDPDSSLLRAYLALEKTGGTIIVCGKTTVDRIGTLRQHSERITVTSLYGGVDYAKTSGAKLVFKNNLNLTGPTVFENISFSAAQEGLTVFANGNELVIGEGVNTASQNYVAKAEGFYLTLAGGSQGHKATSITVNSGIWQRLYGGNTKGSGDNCSVSVSINGGEFMSPVVLGSKGGFTGSINAVINGGRLYQGIYASELGEKDTFDGDVNLVINGGAVYANAGISKEGLGTYNGSFNVTINGGEWGHLVKLCGSEGLKGNITSTLSGAIDFDAETMGTVTFTNPIHKNGADPWLFYHDGFYYYTATTGHSLGLARAANIGDLKYAEFVTVYTPRSGEMWSKNIWSPEIHYYTDEEIGEGNGGWYCYIACDNGDNLYHRMYVIKCLDGDDLFGRWGNPVTGEVNVPQAIIAKDIPDFENTWAAGQTDIRINGKLYMMYVTETGRYRKGDGFYQTENLVEMTNPWTIVGQSAVICKPEYKWEKGGSENGTSPQVVEGGTAVYADDGTVYIIYSGSGYWTTEYQLGQLKYLGGDPLDINNWEKKPTSILYKSDEINGCGHASYVRDHNGDDWICYHAYIGKDTSSGRYAFVEPYHADKNGVVIADGSGHPAPIDKVYTLKNNPMPLLDKISGFDAVDTSITLRDVLMLAKQLHNGIGTVTIDGLYRMLGEI